MLLEGKVALVTGAGQGIGKAIALRFASEGASIVVNDVDEARAEGVRREIERAAGIALSYAADVSDETSVKLMMERTLNEFGKIDILVNNAALLKLSLCVDTSLEDWERTFAVNVRGPFLTMREALKDMIPRKRGKIINVASIAGFVARVTEAAYCASKAAVIQLTKVVALEVAPYHINVNALCPGTTLTETTQATLTSGNTEILARWRKAVPLGNLARVDDQAAMALFLASSSSDHITGQTFVVDGGQSINVVGGHN